MQSDTEGCSNLHLASGGRLLVGLVDILDAYESGGSTEGGCGLLAIHIAIRRYA